MPRLLMHRDVAELLECLPDKHFLYRIFDAASGQVLRSLDVGENTETSEENTDDMRVVGVETPPAAPAPPAVVETVSTPTPEIGERATPAAIATPLATGSATAALPRLIEAPSSTRSMTSRLTAAAGASPLAPAASSAGAIAGRLVRGLRPRAVQPIRRDTRTVLAALLARDLPIHAAVTASAASAWPASASSQTRQRSAGQLLARLSGGHADTPTMRLPNTTRGAVAAALGAAGGDLRRTNAPARKPPDGSAASILRGVLRR